MRRVLNFVVLVWRKVTWSPSKRISLPQAQRSTAWAFMERFEIPDYDHPERSYLTRLRIVQTPWFSLYLHRMDGPDPRPTLHDHPWNFVSIILRGGYSEATAVVGDAIRTARHWGTGTVHRMRAEDTHYIFHLDQVPTWTFLLVGRRRREWGYIDADGTWTRFDKHPHAAEFDAALAARGQR